jgi:hypothetical protein
MIKYFVPEYLGKLLKDKGFDLNCCALHSGGGVMLSGEYKGFNKNHFYYEHGAILWEQAFEWLESKKVFVSCEYLAPDTNQFHYRIDNYNPVYRVCEMKIIDGKVETIDTGKMTGEFGIRGRDEDGGYFDTRWECYEKSIEHALTLI